MKRLIILATLLFVFAVIWRLLDEIPLRVIGQPSSAGILIQTKEVPFFTNPHFALIELV